MTKLLALALLGVGMTSGALALAGYNLAALSWIENAGDTNAWGIRGMMTLIGGGILFYKWLDDGRARQSKPDETCCLYDGYEADLFDDGGGVGDAGGGSADGGF